MRSGSSGWITRTQASCGMGTAKPSSLSLPQFHTDEIHDRKSVRRWEHRRARRLFGSSHACGFRHRGPQPLPAKAGRMAHAHRQPRLRGRALRRFCRKRIHLRFAPVPDLPVEPPAAQRLSLLTITAFPPALARLRHRRPASGCREYRLVPNAEIGGVPGAFRG